MPVFVEALCLSGHVITKNNGNKKYQQHQVNNTRLCLDALCSSTIYGFILSSICIQIAWHCSTCLHQIDNFSLFLRFVQLYFGHLFFFFVFQTNIVHVLTNGITLHSSRIFTFKHKEKNVIKMCFFFDTLQPVGISPF